MSSKCWKAINPLYTVHSPEMLRDNAWSLSYYLKNLKVKKWERNGKIMKPKKAYAVRREEKATQVLGVHIEIRKHF